MLPWTLILDVDSDDTNDAIFSTEPFCSVLSVTTISASDTADYLRQVTEFCNDVVWGTLNVCLIAHPKSLKNPSVAQALDEAIGDLQYGTVAINHWPALGYGLTVTPWGAYPDCAEDIQSGRVVHNTLMFQRRSRP